MSEDKKLDEIMESIKNYLSIKKIEYQIDESQWKDRFFDVLEHLDSEIESLKKEITDLRSDTLTINAIENEGYLRALITLKNEFSSWIEHLKINDGEK